VQRCPSPVDIKAAITDPAHALFCCLGFFHGNSGSLPFLFTQETLEAKHNSQFISVRTSLRPC